MSLYNLLDNLDLLFSTCSTGYDVNQNELCKMLESYKSNKNEWIQFAFRDDLRYTRNLVKKGELYEVILMRWGEGHATSVHSHCGCHCAMKVLQGEIKETLFDFPKHKKAPLPEKSVTLLQPEEVAYISDDIGLHRLENPSAYEEAMTLHVYIPSFNCTDRYDERTGKKQKIMLTFTSKDGQKVPPPTQIYA
ncbi:cysteine dioxygenase type 1-like [Convolutriloba macropyga]|uniref:cysteine dioxygenase type 1-like n=1 Tax=Convolutriloba macropyga TaxID=536237 RepID=UPI003F523BE8